MKNRLLLMLLCFITYFTISSQTYQVTVDSAVAYTPLENSISITQGEEWDDEEYSIPLEFNINLFGDVFNTLVVDANGIVSDEGIDEYEFLSGLLGKCRFLRGLLYKFLTEFCQYSMLD